MLGKSQVWEEQDEDTVLREQHVPAPSGGKWLAATRKGKEASEVQCGVGRREDRLETGLESRQGQSVSGLADHGKICV